jgi:NADH:ubiquinone oxidoreductase subunit H
MNAAQQVANRFIAQVLGEDPSSYAYTELVYAAMLVAVAAVVLAFVALFAGPITVVERRMAGRIQSRVGPDRMGRCSGSLTASRTSSRKT